MTSAPPPLKPVFSWSLLAIVGVPVVAGAVTTGVLVGPGRTRPVHAARIYGRPTLGADRMALQVEVVRFDGDVITPAPSTDLVLHASGASTGEWSGALDAARDEAAELVLTLHRPWSDGSLQLTLEDGTGRALAEAELHGDGAAAAPAPPSAPPDGVSIVLPRGGAVPELPEDLVVELVTSQRPERPELSVEIQGGSLSAVEPPRRHCDEKRCRFTWDFQVVARATATGVTAKVSIDGEVYEREQWLHLMPGALWLSPDGKAVRAAGPREHAFVALHTAQGRIWSTRLKMQVDEAGYASAPLELPSFGPGPVAISLASEPGVAKDRRWVWPLKPARWGASAPMKLLADGLPAARRAEEARQASARKPAFALVVAAAIFELAFLYWQRRRSELELARRMRAADIDPDAVTTHPAAWWLLVLSGALMLGFLALAALALFGAQLPL